MAFELAERIIERFIRVSVGIGIGGLLVLKTAPDFFPHGICKNVLDSGEKFPERCTGQFEEVARKMAVGNSDKISLFINKGMCGVSCGATSLPNGAVLGLPKWYLFESGDDVVNSGMNFKNRGIKWESDMGSTIKESLIPTDDMIAFTIAHELAHIYKSDPKLKAGNIALAPLWLYCTYKLVNVTSKLKLVKMLDILLKVCLFRLSYLVYKKANQRLQNEIEFQADDVAAKCDPRFAQGGVTFFSKRLSLNNVLRILHGKRGEKYYSEEGDEIESYVHPKLTERLRRMESILLQHTRAQGRLLLLLLLL